MLASLLLTLSLIVSPISATAVNPNTVTTTVWWAERIVDPVRGWNAALQIQASASSSHVQVEMWRTECSRSLCTDIHVFGSTDVAGSVITGSRATVFLPITTVRSRDGADDLHELSRSTAVVALRVSLLRPELMAVSLGRYSWISTAAGVLVEN